MKNILIAVIFVFATTSLASAELLTTANPIRKGKWALSLSAVQNSNASNKSNYSIVSSGASIGYGIDDKLDAYLIGGVSNVNGLPSQFTSSITSYGLIAKYAILGESDGFPVSVAAGIGYKALSYKNTAPAGDTSPTGSQLLAGFGISKIIIPFIPYAGLIYRSTSQSGSSPLSQIDLTIGSAIAWSKEGAVLAEYTIQSITPNGGTNYQSGQIGFSVAYKI